MASLAELINSAQQFEFNGVKYNFVELDVEHMGMYTEWLRQKALTVIEQLYRNSPEEASIARNELVKDCAAGVYDYASTECVKSLQSIDGLAKHLVLSAHQSGQDLDINDARQMIIECHAKINKLIAEKIVKNPKEFADQMGKLFGPTFSNSFGQNRTIKRGKKSKSLPSRKSRK